MNTNVSLPASVRVSNRSSLDHASRRAASAAEAAHDAELVQRFKNGDESAFLEIMNRYRDKMFLIARGLLRNPSDAEEITQDTFIRAHRGLAAFRGESSLATWLHCIAVNLARNRYWYFFRRRQQDTLSLDCALSEGSTASFTDLVATEDADPARAATTAEFSVLIHECMEKLPAQQRDILTQRNNHHRSYDEIARVLGVSVGTVKSRIARARENIRTLLAGMCPEFAANAPLGEWFETVRNSGRLALAA